MRSRSSLIACIGLVVLLFATSSEGAARHVLLLQSLDRGNLTLDTFTSTLRTSLDHSTSDAVAVTEFVVNPAGFDESPDAAIVDFLHAAFTGRPPPDLVITTGGPAAAFARKYRYQLFPESPMLFAAVDERFLRGAAFAENETAVAVRNDIPGIIDDILLLLPQTSSVFMVVGSGPVGKLWRRELDGELGRFAKRVTFIWSDAMSIGQIVQQVASLPSNSVIFYLTFGTDGAGGVYAEEPVLAEIHAASNVPLFGSQGALFGHGIVGGHLMWTDELGRTAADVALRILKGESPASIKTPLQTPGAAVFDARELQRWSLSESRLPPGSVVRFREPGVWGRFKAVIIAGVSALIAQALLIGALLINRVKRQRAEQLLRQNIDELNTARNSLSNLSGRLMKAQEQERTWLARELHDDVSQRMAFLAMDLAQLRETLPASATDAQTLAQGAHDAVIALAGDVQGISHHLHSSKIDLVGLAAAAGNFCREISGRHDLKIEYVHENVPTRLPEGIAISLFRVLQEALANAVKHSGARHCKVTVQRSNDALILEVADDGHGFDIDAASQGHGLGLISAQERLKLVNGDVVIKSRPGLGTVIRATVPLQPDHVMEDQVVSAQ